MKNPLKVFYLLWPPWWKRQIKRQDELEESKWKNEPSVPSVLIETDRGLSRMKRVNAISGEFLIDPFDKSRKESNKDIIYTGMPGHIIDFDPSVFPSKIDRLYFGFRYPRGFRMIGYHRLKDEPCTRDLYTGELLRPEKKRQVLIEQGIIDDEGFFLTPLEVDEVGKKIGGGERKVINECYIKPDFSDIDFIKSEFHAFKQSESVVEMAKAMKKTGMAFDKWYFIVLIVAIISIVFIVFITTGGISNLG